MNPEEGKATDVDTEPFAEQKGGCGNGITSSREKNLVIIAFVFGLLVLCLLCAIIMTVVIGLLFPKRDFCLNDHCVKKAGSILRAMDTTMDPCVDFYQFTCGGWMDEYDVDEDSETAIMGKMQMKVYRKFDKIIEGVKSSIQTVSTSDSNQIAEAGVKAIDTYEACSKLYDDYDPEKLIPLMESINGWPMGDKGWHDNTNLKIEDKLSSIIGDFGVAPLFTIAVQPDDEDPTKNIIFMAPPSLPSSFEGYLKLIANIAKKIEGTKKQTIDDDVAEVEKLHTQIKESLNSSNESPPETLTVADLENHLTNMTIDWEKLFMSLLGQNGTDADKVKNLTVIVHNEEKINGILGVVDTIQGDPRALSNYFAINIILNHPLLIIKEVDPGSSNQPKSLNKKNILTNLKANCLQTVSQYLNFAMDHVFIYKQQKSTNKAVELIGYIREAFSELINHYNWLDGPTRRRLITKLQKMNDYVDYPKWLEEKDKINKYYENYSYNKSEPFKTYRDMVAFGVRQAFQTYKEKNDRNVWPEIASFSVSTVNAFYIPYQNNFVLPRAILSPPIYDESNPNYLTFGSIGAIIGHEITHGFDSNGRNHDEIGRMSSSVWSPISTEAYNKLSQCFVDQYSSYKVDAKTKVDGGKTLAENIADNGGLRQAFKAYQRWLTQSGNGRKELPLPGLAKYSPLQMFFISYGQTWCISAGKEFLKNQVKTDEHTPNNFRVIGTLSNMEAFAKAFRCNKPSPMNPVDKCVLW